MHSIKVIICELHIHFSDIKYIGTIVQPSPQMSSRTFHHFILKPSTYRTTAHPTVFSHRVSTEADSFNLTALGF